MGQWRWHNRDWPDTPVAPAFAGSANLGRWPFAGWRSGLFRGRIRDRSTGDSMRAVVLSLLLFLVSFDFAAAQTNAETTLPSVELPPKVARVLRDYERAWMAKDAGALAALFTEDGFVLSNGKPAVRGRVAIRKAYEGAGGSLALRALSWSSEGSVGYIIGAYGPSPEASDTGKFILALRKGRNGAWLIAADMDNSNRRPQGTPTPAPPQP